MCKHYSCKMQEDHRHYINSGEHTNCLLCLVEDKGPMTQETVAGYLGVSKVFISQLERAALKKLRQAIDLSIEDVPVGRELDQKHQVLYNTFNIKAATAEDFMNAE